jgi:hypothetical protein
MDIARGLRACAVDLDEIPGSMAENSFCQMTAAGVPGAKNQDVWLGHD